MSSKLAIPAVRQVISKLAKGEKEEEELVEKIENSCLKFDHDKKGILTPDEFFNVLKLQNGVECTKEEVKTVCGPLPCTKDGKIKIRDFLYLDIHSESAFRAMDRNKDGYITKGELKLAKKKMTMKEVDQVIKEYDIDQDGKLDYNEFLKSKK
eukprot:TRINITY_DN14932_c0_g1_i1.p1 TRINITY_DN14932_c0_g1~~TRINITY_DN14932_c0_g1_i1.p1  ORF type:complete len:153 (-),score=67.88 TRINITY_DN14932_c0_g1_i1:137-595(-)